MTAGRALAAGAGTSCLKRPAPWVLAVAIAGSALALGTVHAVTLCVVVVVLAVATVLACWSDEFIPLTGAARLLFFTAVGLTVLTALQCVPLRTGWLATIAPLNADVWTRALAPFREVGPGWAPISLDPSATRIEILKGVAYLLTFVTAVRVATTKDGSEFLAAAVVGTGVLLALAALVHPALGAERVFGVYAPAERYGLRHIAPLLNSNHLAGYLNLAFCIALAGGLSHEPRVPRPILLGIVLVLAGTQVWIASRGGVATMLVGAVMVLTVRRRRWAGSLWSLGIIGASVLAVLVVAFSSTEEVADDLFDTNISKFAVVSDALRMAWAHRWLGVGRGAFESVYPAFRSGTGYSTWTHPENVVAQWATEWGVGVTAVALCIITWGLWTSSTRARSAVSVGASSALASLALQNASDFSSEVPGVMVGAVACAAIVVAGRARAKHVARPGWSGGRLLAVVFGCAAIVTEALAIPVVRQSVFDERAVLYGLAMDARTQLPAMRDAVRGAILRHPAEPYFPFACAIYAGRSSGDSPVLWLAATLERARVYAPAHFLLADSLARRSTAQARLEYRFAAEQEIRLAEAVGQAGSLLVGGYEDAMELVPGGPSAPAVLDTVARAISNRLPSSAIRLDAALVALVPNETAVMVRAGRDILADLHAGDAAPWCSGSSRGECVARAIAIAARIRQLTPTRCSGFSLDASVRIAVGDLESGLAALEAAADRVTDRVTCLKEVFDAASSVNDTVRARRALELIATAGCSSANECVDNLLYAASREERGSALARIRRACDLAPEDNVLLGRAATLASSVGMYGEALRDYEELARREPHEQKWHQAAAEQRRALLHLTLPGAAR